MLIQNTDRHPTESTRAPPTIGPAAMPSPTTPLQAPMARARSFGSVKVLVMIDSATGFSIDPPTAWIIRKAINQPSPGAMLHSSEPATNTASPTWNTCRRPSRSAVDPDSNSNEASTRA